MLTLLNIEWLKVKNNRTFWILAGLFTVSIFGINYIVYRFQADESVQIAKDLFGSPFAFPAVWNTVTYVSGFLLFISGLMLIINMSNEYAFRTARQNIIDGTSRIQFITAKIIFALIIAIVSTLIVFLVSVFFGSLGSSFSFTNIKYIMYFFVQSCAYLSVALVFSLLFKRQGLGIGIYFLYIFVLENMLSGLLNFLFGKVGYFLPLKSVNKLIGFPVSQINAFSDLPNENLLLFIGICYIFLGFGFCIYKFIKDDL